MQNRRGLFAGMQSGRLSGFVPYKGTKDLPNAGRISRFIRNFVDMKVALCQFSMEWEAAARNLRREEELLAWMRRTARRYATALAGSAVVRSGDRFANRFFFVRPAGGAERYDKRHLFSIGGEDAHFVAGRRRVVVEYGGLRFLPLVCYDLRFPVWCRRSSISRGRRSARRTLRRGSSRPGSTGKRSIGSGRNFPHGATPTISCCDDCARNAVCGKIATFAGNLFRSGRAASRQSPAGLGLTLGLHCLCTIFRMQDAI